MGSPLGETRRNPSVQIASLEWLWCTVTQQSSAVGCKNLNLAGIMTHLCVSSTARSVFDRGYAVSIVEQVTATRDLPDGKGGTITAADVQQASSCGLANLVVVIVEHQQPIPD